MLSAAFPPSRLASHPGQSATRIDPPDLQRYEETDAGHGRIETRIIAVRTKLPAYLDTLWPGLTQIARIERRREHRAFCERQVTYAITSLSPQTHGPDALLNLSRKHWHVENRLFHVRDVTFGEDRSKVRSGAAPQVMAHIRDTALTIIRHRNEKPRPAREAFAANPKAAIRAALTMMN